MSKMTCRCGSVMSDTLVPCPTEGWILREQDSGEYYSAACRDIAAFFAAAHAGQRSAWIAEYFGRPYPTDASDEEAVSDILACHKRRVFLSVAECDRCGRLWVQRGPSVNSYVSYAPDESGYAGILRSESQGDLGATAESPRQ